MYFEARLGFYLPLCRWPTLELVTSLEEHWLMEELGGMRGSSCNLYINTKLFALTKIKK